MYINYEKNPYDGIYFKHMPPERQSKAYAHFVVLLSQCYEKIYNLDAQKIKKNNFSEGNIDNLNSLQVINLAEDCLKYIKELNALMNKKNIKAHPDLILSPKREEDKIEEEYFDLEIDKLLEE